MPAYLALNPYSLFYNAAWKRFGIMGQARDIPRGIERLVQIALALPDVLELQAAEERVTEPIVSLKPELVQVAAQRIAQGLVPVCVSRIAGYRPVSAVRHAGIFQCAEKLPHRHARPCYESPLIWLQIAWILFLNLNIINQ